MAKKAVHQPDPQPSVFEGRFAQRAKQFATSGFVKGMVVTAILFITALALVAGTMGTGALGGLAVNGVMLPDFGAGVAAGFSKMVAFLTTTTIGWGTLAAGGLIGAHLQKKRNKEIIALDDQMAQMDEELARKQERSQQLDQQIASQQQQASAPPSTQRQEQAYDNQRATPIDHNTAEQIYAEGYRNGLKTANSAEPTPQKQSQPQETTRNDNTHALPPKEHMNQVYSEGYLDGIRMAREANAQNAALPPSPSANSQNTTGIQQLNVEVTTPTVNNTLNSNTVNHNFTDNSVSQVAIATANSPGSTASTSLSTGDQQTRNRTASFAAAELQRQAERELSNTKRTL